MAWLVSLSCTISVVSGINKTELPLDRDFPPGEGIQLAGLFVCRLKGLLKPVFLDRDRLPSKQILSCELSTRVPSPQCRRSHYSRAAEGHSFWRHAPIAKLPPTQTPDESPSPRQHLAEGANGSSIFPVPGSPAARLYDPLKRQYSRPVVVRSKIAIHHYRTRR